MLVIGRFQKQNKFAPVIHFDQRDSEAVEVRFEGYDTVAISLSREQYAAFRAAVGKFNPSSTPAPAPRPVPPAPESGDDWSS
jgi:hypothetical protein